MDRVIEVANVDDPHQHADHSDGLGEEGAELVQLLLQGCHLFVCLCHRMPTAEPICRGLVCSHSSSSFENDLRGAEKHLGASSPLTERCAGIAARFTIKREHAKSQRQYLDFRQR